MSKKPAIKHELNKYGMENISYNNKLSIYQLSSDNDCKVVISCDKGDIEDIISQVKRHVDGVDHVHGVVEGTDKSYVIEGNEKDYFESRAEAILYMLDPEDEFESLTLTSKYSYTLSNKPDDVVKGSTTSRTAYKSGTLHEVIEDLTYMPYIHKLSGFIDKQKVDLYRLSLRIQEKLEMQKETRDVMEKIL
ncbi:hypothetical protein 2016DhaA_0220 [Vibrio phage ICP1]|jgi:hypothetical protein|uniref:Uncharacterized protein ORF49 n=1 Tax=Vibrio phage ICP1 TaxID=979525 RepID=F1D171_9CAUD|nr:hypothetical protein ViPhICP1_gp049 [Vibrio phage ICP1]ADX88092.1 hypothetical protein TUST1-191_00230 [Vibrio phage ICP1_2006_D]ADX88319.1 hypothetical protein TUST1-182_00230 [Vibrio phage ICP1_2006_C]ADX88546.1 hypothetical protein TUST1-159_00230 [Vibrio phage ICP1_2006_B]ADX88772.1 hypothetical protein TUST1-17_00230 [Vibrio phage ICP1_2006_A]ADX88998.1 hypothetical protein TUST1-15_00230 [Vibrio phage ICP1_2005_A]ADX89230.1 hypothetical protein TUST1-2_00240 [Vibrio phage ICP1_2001_A